MRKIRNSDSELLFLFSIGNYDAKDTLDKRYYHYSKKIASQFYRSHDHYSLKYEDYFSLCLMSYHNAVKNYHGLEKDYFYAYFMYWANGEMMNLYAEARRKEYGLNEISLISFNATYNNDENELTYDELIGALDRDKYSGIAYREVMDFLFSKKANLSELDLKIFFLYATGEKRNSTARKLKISYSYVERSLQNTLYKIREHFKQ